MFYTDDPLRDFANYDREQAERERGKPRCAECEKPLYNENAYRLGGELYCAECVKAAETYIDEE